MNEGVLCNLGGKKKIRYFIKSLTPGRKNPTYISQRIFIPTFRVMRAQR